MQKFVYEYPTKVYFGEGAAKEHLAEAVSAYGQNVMLAYGGGSVKKNGIYDEVKAILEGAGKKVTDFSGIMSNPTYAKVQEGAALAKKENIDFILAVGGGSVIDCCKIMAAQAKTEEDLWEMEMTEHKFPTAVIPMGAIVTASGTGAEMNGGAVITNEEKVIKAGMAAAAPRFAVLDPAYTMSVPRMQVISGAFDTLSHAMETYFGNSDQDNVSDDVALSIMRNTVVNMRRLMGNINDIQARGNLMWDSAMAENCHASRKIVAISVSKVGILAATAYMPLASLPRNAVIMYLSETLVIHQNIVVGISGTLYRSIWVNKPLPGFTVRYCQSFSLNTRKPLHSISATAVDRTYPVMPHLNTRRNKMLRPMTSTVFNMPCPAYRAIFPCALMN